MPIYRARDARPGNRVPVGGRETAPGLDGRRIWALGQRVAHSGLDRRVRILFFDVLRLVAPMEGEGRHHHSERRVTERYLRVCRPAHLPGVNQNDPTEHGSDCRDSRRVIDLAHKNEGDDGAEHRAGQHGAPMRSPT